jgi:hypothetical protein
MEKVNRIQATQILVFVTCSLFIIAYFAPLGTISDAQPEDDWVAQPMHISQLASSFALSGYSPSQIRTAYGLPSSGGDGTTIAIIDAYDTPSIWTDLGNFSFQFNLPLPTSNNFEVIKMDPNTGTNSDWAQETCLDVEWAHAIAPNAKILLVEAKDATSKNLFSAIDNATNHPDVVAISMSWDSKEYPHEVNSDAHFNKPGIAFFASSGDNGSGVMWPASSANVIAVGGTTLNLNSDGTVSSETGWNGSGGGVSTYEAIPAYQTSYGLTAAKRAVPDVSYNGNPATGVAVRCNSQWLIMGGTSAGAPQWAAIHALGLSATNINLYQKAKLAYSSYFRDITSGSNGDFNATVGYDCVTGLGSPLTFNFGSLTVSPTSGPPGGLLTLSLIGFTESSSVNITYLNPTNSTWTTIINNLATTTTQNFTYSFNAPDLLKSNPAGDNQPFYDNIVFRAQDNSNGRAYNTTIPYTEYRRGLTQIGNATAQGLFGNNTNLATSVFVQNGDALPFSGEWFSPGNISLLWDNTTNLGTISTDNTGFFNTTVIVPTTPAGQHALTINDGTTNFCLNLTRLPTVANDYVDGWQSSDFTINLASDYPMNETFYKINDGPVFNVTSNGQPAITAEGSNNKLEYWSTWNLYETGIVELSHVTLTGIKLDKTTPTGSITPSSINVDTPIISLSLNATDNVSGIAQMRFANENSDWSTWEPYATSKTWTLQNGDGTKTVNVQYMDAAGLTSSTYSCIVNLETPKPTPSPTLTPTIKPAATASPSPTPTTSLSPSNSPTVQPSATPQAPELNIEMVLVLLAASTLMLALIFKRSRK